MKPILKLLGDIDGGLAAALGGFAVADSAHAKLYIAGVIVVGGIGMVLNGVSRYLGGGDVVTVKPPPPNPPAAA